MNTTPAPSRRTLERDRYGLEKNGPLIKFTRNLRRNKHAQGKQSIAQGPMKFRWKENLHVNACTRDNA